MSIARASVQRPVAVTMRIASLVLLGAICATRLPVDLLPKVTLPTIAVVTRWPNVGPEELETQITRPMEQAVSAAPGLYQVQSSTSEGSSMVRIQFQWGTDIGQAAVDVLQLVQRAAQRFPNDPTLQTPLVYKFDPTQFPILIFGVRGESDPVKLRQLLDNQVSPIIESADGVASASITGGLARSIIVNVDPERLRAHRLSLTDVSRRIAQENLNLPAGIAKQGNTEYTIRSLGWLGSPDEIGAIPVGSSGGRLIALSEVATVRDAAQEVRLNTRLNGEPAVGMVISKQSGANTVTTAASVREKIAQAVKLYPNLKFDVAYDQAKFISNSITDVQTSAAIGGLLAVLILLFFLRNVRSTLVVALSIPTSIVSTFALLYMCGFSLNTMSLGGLALATGLIVDDAVVVLENIFRHIERDKKDAREAAVSGADEIMSAVVASTMTVMVVFLPLLLIKGQAGQMFTQFALVVIFSIGISLLDAVTVVPMLASLLIHGDAHREAHKGDGVGARLFSLFGKWLEALDAAYRRGLTWTLHRRWLVLAGAAAASAASLLLAPMIGTEMMPPSDSGDFTVTLKLPVGTALSVTDRMVRQADAIARKHPDVETVFSASGTTLSTRGSTTSLTPYQGSLTVRCKRERKKSTLDIMSDMRKALGALPAVRAMPNQVDVVTQIMTGGGQNISVVIFGDDPPTLARLSKEVMQRVRSVPGLENVDVNWQDAMPEIQWHVDRKKALQMGVSFSDVAGAINTATNGTIASYYQQGGFQYPIIVQLPEEKRKTVDAMGSIPIRSIAGEGGIARDVLLSQVATPVEDVGPSQVTRQDRRRYIAVQGQPQGRPQSEVQADVEKALAGLELPQGYYWDWGTEQKRRGEEFAGMGLAVFLAIALIYMLLASQFESFVYPLVVLTSVPLSAIGVALALFLTGRAFGLTAFVGLLMLVGIVVKNGILLVDYTNALRRRGMERDEAVLTAGPTRLRPILMTSCAAILGMLPIAIGMGEGSETQAPMATAVIGGLLTSTLLTLYVVPIVYTLFDDLGRFITRRRSAA